MSGAKTYHRSYGLHVSAAVEELPVLVEVIPKGVVDDTGVSMLA